MVQTVIVSGGTGGLGSAVTRKLLDDGWRVVVPWVVEAELSRLPDSDRLVALQADLFDESSVAEVVAAAAGDPSAPVKAVVNLVGGFAMGERVDATPVDEFERLLRLNLRPLYLLSAAAIPKLIDAGGGSIVGVSAKAAFAPFSGAAGYITSKAAVWAFISALAAEYKDDAVRANAILPSVIDTPGNRESQPDSSRKGWVSPEAIAETVAFLVSDASAAVTGAQVPVPGVG
ncbi:MULTISPECIES: SDR family NAD(P)-dependent oxidoreductase [Gordonia]|jgi:NAD(P)-dependent dehydrogenase (short-subunit alcohol dehydrogenase family)|uniref:Oxidoreductase n=2 Tax=Gordonia alkanivorans TaxID=84096 RepID=W9DBR4_9ACTN|nr:MULTISPECIES: SDR family NAD(P)-dependent oxidoreductase [Gordonia]ETA05832.1 oxidoreductase [Gordonia alkanivorans CGMCC 6845]MDH3005856.1 SDR family NAD(P)-dependent oxidoreductase [Gordonia alkanivorans]MDH3011218.1 SDR family NAD(P)-dependent oxidoreductase [Gordonia alkanivorans]MDH3016149.1 SDR family NAD(P)-dependent oxidoreductase [Gordonia alkanivorans]MDH3019743.1 SDR family NAD(P)-dependent oxidoreductase [Gordonia alkanivorans]